MKKYMLFLAALFLAMPLILLAQQTNQPAPTMNQMYTPGMQNQMYMHGMQNNMPMYMHGMQNNMPWGCCGMMKNGMMLPQISDSEAKNIVNDYLKNNNLKGYTIVNIKKFNSHMGPEYYAELKDSAGNLFNIAVAHGGIVRGPFPTSEIKWNHFKLSVIIKKAGF